MIKDGVYQGSVLSPLLFIEVLEVMSYVFRSGCPQELLNDDLVLIAESMEEQISRPRDFR